MFGFLGADYISDYLLGVGQKNLYTLIYYAMFKEQSYD
jgi:hypothetical protein